MLGRGTHTSGGGGEVTLYIERRQCGDTSADVAEALRKHAVVHTGRRMTEASEKIKLEKKKVPLARNSDSNS